MRLGQSFSGRAFFNKRVQCLIHCVTTPNAMISNPWQTPRLTASFPEQPAYKAGTRKVNHSGFWWSKRWWGGSGISWTISKSFAPRLRQKQRHATLISCSYDVVQCIWDNASNSRTANIDRQYYTSLLRAEPSAFNFVNSIADYYARVVSIVN